MTDLRQDYESFKRISDVVEQLKYDYAVCVRYGVYCCPCGIVDEVLVWFSQDFRLSRVKTLLTEIQSTIQVKMEEAARADDCTFQILIPNGRSK